MDFILLRKGITTNSAKAAEQATLKSTLALDVPLNTRLTYPLRYDYSEKHNQYFPHIYGPINLSAVIKIYEMPKNSDGSFRLPDELQE